MRRPDRADFQLNRLLQLHLSKPLLSSIYTHQNVDRVTTISLAVELHRLLRASASKGFSPDNTSEPSAIRYSGPNSVATQEDPDSSSSFGVAK
jgi:hypothetical protein